MDNQLLTVLLGPLGLTAGLLVLVWLMVTEKVVPKGRLQDALDEVADHKAETRRALDLVDATSDAMDGLTKAVEARNKMETERLQRESKRRARPAP